MHTKIIQLLSIILFFSSQALCASGVLTSMRSEVVRELQDIKSGLGELKPYSLFDLHLSQNEHDLLQSLHVQPQKPFDIYGKPEGKASDMMAYFESLGNHPEKSRAATAIVYRFMYESLAACGRPAAWVTIRPTIPNSDFDVPRWHTDGTFFPNQGTSQVKLLTALQGPGTLLCDVSQEIRQQYRDICKQVWDDENFSTQEWDAILRPRIVDLVVGCTKQQAQTRQGLIFIVGNPRAAAIHSEPAMHENRLFLSILPGAEEQIQYLQNQRNS